MVIDTDASASEYGVLIGLAEASLATGQDSYVRVDGSGIARLATMNYRRKGILLIAQLGLFPVVVEKALQSGASGFISKRSAPEAATWCAVIGAGRSRRRHGWVSK